MSTKIRATLAQLVWLACADDPDLFTSPSYPLTEAFGAAGLVWSGDLVAPSGFDFARWRTGKRVGHLAGTYQLDHDEALAVLALSTVYEQVAAVFEHARQGSDAEEFLAGLGPRESGEGAVEDDGADSAPEVSAGLDRRLVGDLVGFLEGLR